MRNKIQFKNAVGSIEFGNVQWTLHVVLAQLKA